MIRIASLLAAAVLLALLFGARSSDPGEADPLRVAWLTEEAAAQAEAADAALSAAETLMRDATDEARRGQAAILGGTDDPRPALDAAGAGFEAAAAVIADARADLALLDWTLRAIDPQESSPQLGLEAADLVDIGAQWRATALPSSALAELRRQAELTLAALEDGLAGLETDDPSAALAATDRADGLLAQVTDPEGELSTLGYWVDTVQALIDAARAIALAAQAGDAAALAQAQAAYDAAATNAGRADQALTIALGEAATEVTGPASASSAEALRAVIAAREQLSGLSILR